MLTPADRRFFIEVACLSIVAGVASFFIVLFHERLLSAAVALWHVEAVPHILLSATVAGAAVLWVVSDGEPFTWSKLFLRVFAGAVFGPIAGKLAVGLGAGEALQMAAEGAGAVHGPAALIKPADLFKRDK